MKNFIKKKIVNLSTLEMMFRYHVILYSSWIAPIGGYPWGNAAICRESLSFFNIFF